MAITTGGIKLSETAGTPGFPFLTVQSFPDRWFDFYESLIRTVHVGVGPEGKKAADLLSHYQRRNRKGDPGLESWTSTDPQQVAGLARMEGHLLLFLSGSLDDPRFQETRQNILANEPYLLWTLVVGGDGKEKVKPQENEIVIPFEGNDSHHPLCSFILQMDNLLTQPTLIGIDMADYKSCSGALGKYHQTSGRSDNGFGRLAEVLAENRELMRQAKAVTCSLINLDPDFQMSELTKVEELVSREIGSSTGLMRGYDYYSRVEEEPGVMLLII